MRYVIIFCIAGIIVGCHSTKNNAFITDLQQDNVNGAAMKIITKTYLVKNGVNELSQTIIDDFNRDGLVTQDSIIDTNKQLTLNKFIYEKGNLKEIQTFLDGKQNGTTAFEYDINGNLKSVKELDSDAKLTQYYNKITLNHFGLLTSTYSFDNKGKMTAYIENHYKGTQRIRGFTKNENSTTIYRFNISLNQMQDPISLQEYSNTDGITKSKKFTYSYGKLDSQKNWGEQITYVDKKPFQITRRVISYYN